MFIRINEEAVLVEELHSNHKKKKNDQSLICHTILAVNIPVFVKLLMIQMFLFYYCMQQKTVKQMDILDKAIKQTRSLLPKHHISSKYPGRMICNIIPRFHALTVCDYTSHL